MPAKSSVPTDLLVHLRRARDLADRDYAEPLDLEALAGAAGVSKYHFLRSFAAEYGQTPAQYLSHRRVERAQDLLRATNQAKYAETGVPRIPGCYVFMHGLSDRRPLARPVDENRAAPEKHSTHEPD